MIQEEIIHKHLSRDDMSKTLCFMNNCLRSESEADFHNLIQNFTSFLGYEYILYCYTKASYDKGTVVEMVNLSNPPEWMEEYDSRGFLKCDPVRSELENRLKTQSGSAFILWDSYERKLTEAEENVIRRRKHHGLNYGCSVYDNSTKKDFTFLISLSSSTTRPDMRTELISQLIISPLMSARKRLDACSLFNVLSDKEKETAEWLAQGKTNWEIGRIMDISENTVKYHLKNIFSKLHVSKRQQAVNILLAIKYLNN